MIHAGGITRSVTCPSQQGFRSLQQRFPRHVHCSEAVFRDAIAALQVWNKRILPRANNTQEQALIDLALCAGSVVEPPALQTSPPNHSTLLAACKASGKPNRREARPATAG